MYANFLLGAISARSNVVRRLGRVPLDLVARHAINDHGDITPDERDANVAAMRLAGEIVSRYPVDPTDPRKGMVRVTTVDGWGRTIISLEKSCRSSSSSPASSARPTSPCEPPSGS
jgi:hypothetical protein